MILTELDQYTTADFLAGAVLLVDKPMEWTSFDVVNKLRYSLSRKMEVKRLKVGHAGTLDPMATGLLILCTGKLTKTIDSYQGMGKTYTGRFELGATTPSYDAESEINQRFDFDHIRESEIEETRKSFLGEIEQIPPIFSAIKIKGQAAYKLARKGQEVVMKSRRVTIDRFDVTSQELPNIEFEIECSKGTYIRSIANDFGRKLNNGAYLTALRRTKIGKYDVKDAFSVFDIVDKLAE